MNMDFLRLMTIAFAICVAIDQKAAFTQVDGRPSSSPALQNVEFRFRFEDQDQGWEDKIRQHLRTGKNRIEKFFGQPFHYGFEVVLLPDRAKFDEYFEQRWKIPKTEAWMVASGVADRMVLLSPRVWKTQAAEHNPDDEEHIRDLVAHELVHVYHGQKSPKPDFDGMDDCGWFVEGLAVYVSGQLDHAHRDSARDAISKGVVPTRLANAWSGRYRYGVSGSLVRYIDQRFGRSKIQKLMEATSNDEILKILNLSENELLESWSKHVTAHP